MSSRSREITVRPAGTLAGVTRRDRSALLADACALLRCPLCGEPLAPAGESAVRCPARHTFDVARHGYLSLLSGSRPTSGDDDAMAVARARFLDTGAYDPIRDAVADLAAPALSGERAVGSDARMTDIDDGSAAPVVLDIGAGTGHYLATALGRAPESARGIALDTSTRALRVAARAHPGIVAATWDAFKPFPLPDASVDVVLDVFAPRNPAECARVLRPTGRLVVARPTGRHLAELRDEVAAMVSIDPAKEERLAAALGPRFAEIETCLVEQSIALDPEQARDLIGMTPSARHLDAASAIGHGLEVTISVLVSAYALR